MSVMYTVDQTCDGHVFTSFFFLSTSTSDPINGSASASASVLQNPETVIYASVKQRDKRWASEKWNIQIKTLKKSQIFLENSHLVWFDFSPNESNDENAA